MRKLLKPTRRLFRIACLFSMVALVLASVKAVAQSNRLQTSRAVVDKHSSLVVNARPGRQSVMIYGTEATKVFCGSADVTETSGLQLPAELWHGITFDTSDEVWCIAPTSRTIVAAIEVFR
jgi:hypothetical protein